MEVGIVARVNGINTKLFQWDLEKVSNNLDAFFEDKSYGHFQDVSIAINGLIGEPIVHEVFEDRDEEGDLEIELVVEHELLEKCADSSGVSLFVAETLRERLPSLIDSSRFNASDFIEDLAKVVEDSV